MIRECVETGISNAIVNKSKAQLKPLPHLKSSCGLVWMLMYVLGGFIVEFTDF
jgi:hypothetical protein